MAAADLHLSGRINPEAEYDQSRFKPNFASYLEVQTRQGDMRRTYFSFHESIDLNLPRLKKVTIYAP